MKYVNERRALGNFPQLGADPYNKATNEKGFALKSFDVYVSFGSAFKHLLRDVGA